MKRVSAEGTPDDPSLMSVFSWAKSNRAWVHLTGFIFFSLLIHGAGFYLFKVVYPPPIRMEAQGEKITLMDPGNPGVRALMQRMEDRTVFLFPPSRNMGVRLDDADADVRFSPSYQNVELELEPPAYSWDVPPPIDFREEVGALSAPDNQIQLSRSGGLAEREFAPWSVFHDYVEQAQSLPNFTASLSVSEDGKVEVLEIDSEMESDDRQQLRAIIESTLRFEPATKTASGEIRSLGLPTENDREAN